MTPGTARSTRHDRTAKSGTIGACFLGVGGAGQQDLGHASLVIELSGDDGGRQTLLVDCGPGVLRRFRDRYGRAPDAVFVSHCHLDHIADLEALFFQTLLSAGTHRPRLFVPVELVTTLHQRLATYPGALAEGGVNFWDAFQMIPISGRFLFGGLEFRSHPARHHAPGSAFSLHLPGQFFFSGDTRPVPEVLAHALVGNELIFHDASLVGNPSHSGIDDLEREYCREWLDRLHVYHYHDRYEAEAIRRRGFRVVEPGQRFEFVQLPMPRAQARDFSHSCAVGG